MQIHAAAETALIDALDRRGFIDWDNGSRRGAPRISAHGRVAIAKATGTPAVDRTGDAPAEPLS